MEKITKILWAVLWIGFSTVFAESITYSRSTGDLHQVIADAPPGATVICDSTEQLELHTPLSITQAITLTGLNARLPEKLGKTSLLIVDAEGVTLTHLELHGNYDSVDQVERAPLILIRRGNFRLENCSFYDGTKDGVEISPKEMKHDIVGGTVKNIQAFRMGRDAVSLSGGNLGQRVRNVTIENVSLKKGYHRGAVEVSDGTDNISVRGVYAEDCRYAIDVQDHRGASAPNTNITIEDVTAVNCVNLIRTANSPRGHARLVLSNLTSEGCERPVRIKHTQGITIEGLKILKHRSLRHPPIALENCQDVVLKNVSIESWFFRRRALKETNCENLQWDLQP